MSKHQQPRINRRTAARMLRRAPVAVPDTLADLLAAAAAPPRDSELVGEQTATAAFLEVAHRPTVLKPRSPSMIKSALAKLLTVKIAAVAAAVCTVGGVATAAVTGHMPLPSHNSSTAPSTSSHAAGASVTPSTTPTAGTASSAHQASPSPSLVGLCQAYTAGAGSDHGKALQNPAFTALITAADGKSKVDAYCAALVKAKPAGSSSAQGTGSPAASTAPGRSADGHEASTDHPTGAPDTHPTGAPTTHPTGATGTHPTGAPVTHTAH